MKRKILCIAAALAVTANVLSAGAFAYIPNDEPESVPDMTASDDGTQASDNSSSDTKVSLSEKMRLVSDIDDTDEMISVGINEEEYRMLMGCGNSSAYDKESGMWYDEAPPVYSKPDMSRSRYSTSIFYDQLSETEQHLYDSIYDACEALLSDTSSTLAKDAAVPIDCAGWNKLYSFDDIGEAGASFQEKIDRGKEIYKMFRYDNPQFFFLGSGCYYYYLGSGNSRKYAGLIPAVQTADTYSNRPNASDFTTGKTRFEYRQAAADAEAACAVELSADDTQYTKLVKICRYICKNTEGIAGKDTSLLFCDQTSGGVFRDNIAASSGYAMALAYLCNANDIECIAVAGTDGGKNCSWNRVRLGEKWYDIDLYSLNSSNDELTLETLFLNGSFLNKRSYTLTAPFTNAPDVESTYSAGQYYTGLDPYAGKEFVGLKVENQKPEYYTGEAFDDSKVTVTLLYKNKSGSSSGREENETQIIGVEGHISGVPGDDTIYEMVIEDHGQLTFTGFSSEVPGDVTVTVTFRSVSADLNISVVSPEKETQCIEILQKPRDTYYIGEELTDSGRLRIQYTDDTEEEILISKGMISGYDKETAGEQTLTVSFGGMTAQYDVSVIGIKELKFTPSKTRYIIGEELRLEGETIEFTYDNGLGSKVSADDPQVTVSGFDSSKAGKKTVTLTYHNASVSFDVYVYEVKTVTLSRAPTRKQYTAGDEKVSVSGGVLSVGYTDGTSEQVYITDDMIDRTSYDLSTAGTKKVLVKYGGKDVSFTVTVVAEAVTSISVYGQTAEYYLHDEFDKKGYVIVNYKDATRSRQLSLDADGVEIAGFDTSKSGVKKITVKYQGKTAVYNITVSVDPKNAPVTVGTNGYETLAQAVKSITGSGEYVITVAQELTENSVTLPRTPSKIIINSKNGGVIRTGSVTANCDLVLNCPVEGVKSGAKPSLKAAKNITIENKAVLGALSGSKESVLTVKNDVIASSITSFKAVIADEGKTLSLSEKIGSVGEFEGTLKMTSALQKNSIQITKVSEGTFILPAGAADNKGKLMIPKITLNDIGVTLTIRIVDKDGNAVLIPDGQPIAAAGGKDEFCNKILIDNATEAHPEDKNKIKAFLYNKEIRAEYADALTLSIDGQSDKYPNFTALFNKINADFAQHPAHSYEITLNGDFNADAFVFPAKVNTKITINGCGSTLTIPVNSISPKCDLELNNITIASIKSGKTQALTISAAANKSLSLIGFRCDSINAIKGAKGAVLDIDGDITVKDVGTFASVHIGGDSTLSISGKMTSVDDLNGRVWLKTAKNGTATVTNADDCTFILTKGGLNNKGFCIVPKVTVKSISGTVKVGIVDENGDTTDIPGGQTVIFTNGTENFSSNISVMNTVDGKSDAIKAFLNGREYQAYYANALTLDHESSIAGNYPNFELMFAAIAKDTSGGEYTITLNEDMAPAKFVLPAKAGSKLTINGSGHILTLGGISSLSPKYALELRDITIVNKNARGADVLLAINSGKLDVTLDNVSFNGAVTADELTVNGAWNGICSGITANTLTTDSTLHVDMLEKKQNKINSALNGSLEITVVNADGAEVTLKGKAVIFATFKGSFSNNITVTNNGGTGTVKLEAGKIVVQF